MIRVFVCEPWLPKDPSEERIEELIRHTYNDVVVVTKSRIESPTDFCMPDVQETVEGSANKYQFHFDAHASKIGDTFTCWLELRARRFYEHVYFWATCIHREGDTEQKKTIWSPARRDPVKNPLQEAELWWLFSMILPKPVVPMTMMHSMRKWCGDAYFPSDRCGAVMLWATYLFHRFWGNCSEILNVVRIVLRDTDTQMDYFSPLLVMEVYPKERLRKGQVVRFLLDDYCHDTPDELGAFTGGCMQITCDQNGKRTIHTSTFTAADFYRDRLKPVPEKLHCMLRFMSETRHWRLINISEDENMDDFLFGRDHKAFYLYGFEDYCVHGVQFLTPPDAGPFPPTHWKVAADWMAMKQADKNEFVSYFRNALSQGYYRIVYWGDYLKLKDSYYY